MENCVSHIEHLDGSTKKKGDLAPGKKVPTRLNQSHRDDENFKKETRVLSLAFVARGVNVFIRR